MHFLQILRRLSPFQIIALSFLFLIFFGASLLMLPIATTNGHGASLIDALFTAVSATCVTGLTTVNTATYWTLFGKIVILCLIQIGGFGVVTVAVAIVAISGRKVGLMQRNLSKEAVAAPALGGIVPLLYFILRLTFLFEGLGALFLLPSFIAREGVVNGIGFAIFHSISAFCNAGFDLFGDSLVSFVDDPLVNLTIMGLIIAGGLGFVTWADIRTKGFHIHAYSLQSKIVLVTTVLLIFLPAFLFMATEIAPRPGGAHIWASFFQSVTTRTAGFNSIDLNEFSEGARGILIILMLIGGSPGSTAGGFKTTTAFSLLASMFAAFRRKQDVNAFSRRLSPETLRDASTVFWLYLLLFICGSLALTFVDHVPLLAAAFETASAIGTVGLSIGVTEHLSDPSLIIMMLLMFFGRIGALTMIFATHKEGAKNFARMPEEKITVG